MVYRLKQSIFFRLLFFATLGCILLLASCSAWPVDGNVQARINKRDNPNTAPLVTTIPTLIPSPTPIASPTPIPQVDRSAAYIYEANPELTPVNYESAALLRPSDDMGEAYMDRITFICDSPTYWMWPHELLSGGKESKQIWTGPEGTMTLAYQSTYYILDPFDNIQRPIRDVVTLHKPDIMIIALGINGISFMDEDYFTDEYTDLVTDIKEISPDTILILQSIYPITPQYIYYGSITNAMITEGNSWILKIAEERGCPYLDTISVLLNDEGHAKRDLMVEDGLHLNVAGLTTILEYIRTHAYMDDTGGGS